MIVRPLLMAGLVLVGTACSGSDDDGGDADADVAAWCEQLDAAVTASADLDELAVDDPETDGALASVQDELAALADLDAPPAIAGDWETVNGPLPTTDTGGFDVQGEYADAGDRIAEWALEECDLSSAARTELESRDD